MELSQTAQIAAFAVFAFLAVAGALGMATTMSMFRSAILLMASFVGVAGLFILLAADLLGMLQVMMYVGGMLVMALFMVLFSTDPGGEMMSSMMKLGGAEKLFSSGLARPQQQHGGQEHDQHGGQEHDQHGGQEHDQHGGGQDHDQHGGGHGDMSMFTPIKKPAAILAGIVAAALVALVLARPGAWAVSPASPDPDSSARIGHLLMGKYMIAFEGAGLLILLGIFGAVWVARSARHAADVDRERLRAAVDEPPADVDGNDPEEEKAS